MCKASANSAGLLRALLANADLSTTMIYTHVLNKGGMGVVSPIDQI